MAHICLHVQELHRRLLLNNSLHGVGVLLQKLRITWDLGPPSIYVDHSCQPQRVLVGRMQSRAFFNKAFY